MMKIFMLFPSPKELIDKAEDEISLREHLKSVVYKQNTDEALLAYKMLAYILATNRTTIKELKGDDRVPVS